MAAKHMTIRGRGGRILGRIEYQALTRRSIARDAHGVIVSIYDERADTTRDARGVLIGRGDLLAALILRGEV